MWQVFVVWWQVLTHSSSVPSIAPLDGLPSRQAPRAQRCSSLPPVYPSIVLICHARNDGAAEPVSATFACRYCGHAMHAQSLRAMLALICWPWDLICQQLSRHLAKHLPKDSAVYLYRMVFSSIRDSLHDAVAG